MCGYIHSAFLSDRDTQRVPWKKNYFSAYYYQKYKYDDLTGEIHCNKLIYLKY